MAQASDIKRPKKRSDFPYFLEPNQENQKLLLWIGKFLKGLRGSGKASVKAPAFAKNAGASLETIRDIESGIFNLSLGEIRQILRRGYGITFEDVLEACHKDNQKIIVTSDEEDLFKRDWHYRLCYSKGSRETPTPLLFGGKPKSFLWAAPFRKLNGQKLVTELMEIAPVRKLVGFTDTKSHEGIEIIHVIKGSIRIYFKGNSEKGKYDRLLIGGESIHFNSSFPHAIQNAQTQHTTLLLIVRLQELP